MSDALLKDVLNKEFFIFFISLGLNPPSLLSKDSIWEVSFCASFIFKDSIELSNALPTLLVRNNVASSIERLFGKVSSISFSALLIIDLVKLSFVLVNAGPVPSKGNEVRVSSSSFTPLPIVPSNAMPGVSSTPSFCNCLACADTPGNIFLAAAPIEPLSTLPSAAPCNLSCISPSA